MAKFPSIEFQKKKILLDQIDDRFELLESIPSEEKFFYLSKVDLLNEKERLLKRLEELIKKTL
ncbi:hypothetical protein [Leptospira noguchii]|uniref:hypothetical protein n=1 Tax=Leptospira noguchii TaxID=28182 RepID=UPI000773C846|nr:hypothetical protein [Leptospira noguchii]